MDFLDKISIELRKSAKLALPLVSVQLIYAVSGILVTIMVSYLGEFALAANALVFGVYLTFALFFFGVQNAVSALVAQYHGASNIIGVNLIVSQGVIAAFILAVPMIMGLWYLPQILGLVGQKKELVELATPYCHIMAMGILPLNIMVVIEQFLIGISHPRPVFIFGILKIVLDLSLIYSFVFGKWMMPKLGLAGVGYGMAISSVIMLTVSWLYVNFSLRCKPYKIFTKFFKFNRQYFYRLIKTGLPLGTMYCIELAFFTTVAFMMGILGSELLAAYQVAYQCLVFMLTIIFGISQAVTVRIAYEAGRGNRESFSLIAYLNGWVSFVLMLFIAGLYNYYPKEVLKLIVDIKLINHEFFINQLIQFLFLVAILQLIDAFRMVFIGALRGLNDNRFALIVSVVSFWCVAFPVSYLLAFVFHLAGIGVWIGLIMGIFLSMVGLFLRFRYLSKVISLEKIGG